MTKSANMRVALLPYPVIAAAVGGNPDAIARVIRHYSSYIAALSIFQLHSCIIYEDKL